MNRFLTECGRGSTTKTHRSSAYVLNTPGHIWSVDFVHGRLSKSGPYKMLTAIDEFVREALTVSIRTKMKSEDVLEAL